MRATHGAHELRIAGITAFSTVDWPEQMTATLFLQGCPWDCFYCHNPELIDPRGEALYSWSDVMDLLADRVGLLDGVVFSGGEPTMQRGLVPAMQVVRSLGFGVGLHTAGTFPSLLAQTLPYVDWVGLDIKAEPADYAAVTGRPRSGESAWRSLELVLAHSQLRVGTRRPLDYEVRTTVHPAVTDDASLGALADRLADAGVSTWAVQRFREVGARVPMPRIGGLARNTLHLDQLPADRFTSLIVR